MGIDVLDLAVVCKNQRHEVRQLCGERRIHTRQFRRKFVALSFGLLLAGSTLSNAGSDSACGHGYPLCNGSLFPSLNHLVVIALVHRVWAGVLLVLALWVLIRSRRDRAGAPPIKWAAAVVSIIYIVQAGLGFLIVGVSDSTAIEVLHSSIGSLTWMALMALLSLTRTLPRTLRP